MPTCHFNMLFSTIALTQINRNQNLQDFIVERLPSSVAGTFLLIPALWVLSVLLASVGLIQHLAAHHQPMLEQAIYISMPKKHDRMIITIITVVSPSAVWYD